MIKKFFNIVFANGLTPPEGMPTNKEIFLNKIIGFLSNIILWLAIVGIIFYIFVLFYNSNKKDK